MNKNYLKVFIILACMQAGIAYAQTSSDYAVQLSAEVQQAPPEIKLSWKGFPDAVTYTIYRKSKEAASWGAPLATLSSSDTFYKDRNIIADSAYEYEVVKTGGPIMAIGFIYAGVTAPAIHNRGTLLLLVDTLFTDSCAMEISRMMKDIRGDGWQVIRRDVSRTLPDTAVHQLIKNINDGNRLTAVLLLGHIAVPYSGDINPDGHPNHLGAWPADVYYADLDGKWTDNTVNSTAASSARNRNVPGDGKWDQSTLPSPTELEVSRIDFYDMPVFHKTEVQLMKRYLDRAHLYKMDSIAITKRALMDDNFGIIGAGEAVAVTAWRTLPPLVGRKQIEAKDFITTLNDSSYQWAYGCGGGSYTSASGIGTTADFDTNKVHAVFTMLFGSYFGDWNTENNFLRAPLCSEVPALTSCWAGRPNWFFHHMALGENIGYSTKLTQNNIYLYIPGSSNYGRTFVHVALMGDLTLRTDYIKPPADLAFSKLPGKVKLSWTPSPDTAVIGYYVYQSDSAFGKYQLLSALCTVPEYIDSQSSQGLKYYMVRPVKPEHTFSGNYYNLGIGIVDTLFIASSLAAPAVALSKENVIIYPNPATHDLNITLHSKISTTGVVYLRDALGREVYSKSFSLHQGNNHLSVDLNNHPAGIYTAVIHYSNKVIARKYIKR